MEDSMNIELEIDQDTLAIDFIDQLTMHSLRDIIRLMKESKVENVEDLEYNTRVLGAALTLLEYMGLPNVD
jgi:hypothetical protein